jgi:glycosyltransferase involved in cell wall biosynthesis
MGDTHRGNDSKLLSVVMPAYNVEAFIGASLHSALTQRHARMIELIVVDDGSTDHTLARIEAIAAASPPGAITVISRPHAGVSAARNTALAHAKAPYLGFLDSDDLWSADFSDKIIPLLKTDIADIIEFNVGIIDARSSYIEPLTLIEPNTVGLHEVGGAELINLMKVNQLFSGARVYRRKLWDDVYFPAGRVYEDSATIPFVYTRARTVYRLAGELYQYRRRHGSITQKATLHTVESLSVSAEEALARCGEGHYDTYWLLVFTKLFRQACLQVSRTEPSDFIQSLHRIASMAESYEQFVAQRGRPPRLTPRWQIYADRLVFRSKKAIKKALGRELRPIALNDVH